jgi:hypothetical protein
MMRKWLAAVAPLLFLAAAAHADEGIWTFDNFPAAKAKSVYGVDITQAWLDKVRGAAVRLSGGCSASVVSAEGLVLTNHHCVRGCAQSLSTAQTDYIRDGFQAGRREGEKLCPGMQAEILGRISDVTPTITKATTGKTGQDFVHARDGAIAAQEKQGCAGREALYRCQVITLYQGGQYKLYEYRKYTDVRLVAAPEMQTAFFGGDPDNFNFPRYDLDFSFVRLYQDGRPAATPDHLVWRDGPPRDGEAVFVAGNPGTTQRLLTAEQLETIRDKSLPAALVLYSELRGRLQRFTEESAEHARIADDTLFGIENSYKLYTGQEKALVDPALIAAKRADDAALKAKVGADAKLKADIGDPWREIAAAQTAQRELYDAYTMEESRAGFRSELFGYARALVRAAQERAKPDTERLSGYADSQLPLLQKQVLDATPVYPDLEELTLEFWLGKLRETLTADSPATKLFLGKDSPQTLAARLAKSGLGDPALRRRLWEGGMAAINASTDPMIRYVLATDTASRAVRKQWESRVSGPVDRAQQRIARARFAIFGTGTYPDATFSLRLSYGKVTGWTENGATISPFTRFAGLWPRATGQFPFNLAPRWQRAQGKLNPDTVFDFTTNNDIIGGNSGSPAIDAQGRVIGAIFDGNIDSLGASYRYDARHDRAVAVSTGAITEALRKVYGNTALADELTNGHS